MLCASAIRLLLLRHRLLLLRDRLLLLRDRLLLLRDRLRPDIVHNPSTGQSWSQGVVLAKHLFLFCWFSFAFSHFWPGTAAVVLFCLVLLWVAKVCALTSIPLKNGRDRLLLLRDRLRGKPTKTKQPERPQFESANKTRRNQTKQTNPTNRNYFRLVNPGQKE